MIKRTIEVSQHPSHLSVRRKQLEIRRHTDDETAPLVGSIPCEDIGLLVIDHPQTTFTQGAMNALTEAGAAVLFCGRQHLPTGMLLPLGSHSEIVWRLQDQIHASKPKCKQLWRQIVRAKIDGQARNLDREPAAGKKLRALARGVRSGDAGNAEAQAARLYWQTLREIEPAWAQFKRDPDGKDLHNGILNYGYAAMRAAVARALVAAGLLPAIGLHHRNRANAFCLADDLVEPLRPIVDGAAVGIVRSGASAIDRDTKARLLELLQREVRCGEQAGPLLVNLHRYAASLVKCLTDEQDQLDIPAACETEPF